MTDYQQQLSDRIESLHEQIRQATQADKFNLVCIIEAELCSIQDRLQRALAETEQTDM